MFKVAAPSEVQTYPWPVSVALPGENNVTTTQKFKLVFKRMSQTELDEIHEQLKEKELTDRGLCLRVTAGWEDVADAHGNALDFNDENFGALLDMYPTQPSVVTAFYDSIKGSKRKN